MIASGSSTNGGATLASPTPKPSPGPTPTPPVGGATGSATQNRTTAGAGPAPFNVPTPKTTTPPYTGPSTTYNGKPLFGNSFPNWGVGNAGSVSGKPWSQYQTPGYRAPQPTVPVSDSNPLPTGIVKSPQFVPQRFGINTPLGSVPNTATIPQIMNLSPGDIHNLRPNLNNGPITSANTADGTYFSTDRGVSGSTPNKRGYTNAQLVAAANEAVGGARVPGTRGATLNQVAQAAFARKNNDRDRPLPNPFPRAIHIADQGFTYGNSYSQGAPGPGESADAYNMSNLHNDYTPPTQTSRAPLFLNSAARAAWNPRDAYLNPTTVAQ